MNVIGEPVVLTAARALLLAVPLLARIDNTSLLAVTFHLSMTAMHFGLAHSRET